MKRMERIVNKSKSFAEADEWDRKQYSEMTSEERFAIAEVLKRCVYGHNIPDVRTERLASKCYLHDASLLR